MSQRDLAALHRLGSAEFEPGEREQIEVAIKQLNRVSVLAIGTEGGR